MEDVNNEYQTKDMIMKQYDEILDEYQLANPNIPVYEIWHYGTPPGCSPTYYRNYDKYLNMLTVDKDLADKYKNIKNYYEKYEIKETKLRYLSIEKLRELYPLDNHIKFKNIGIVNNDNN